MTRPPGPERLAPGADDVPNGRPERRADAARNRTVVLGTARRMLDAGDTALPMNVLARDAGVGVGTVYRHFATRQALLEELAHDSLERLLAAARAAAAEPDPGRGLADLLRTALDRLLVDAALGAVLRSDACACAQTSQLLAGILSQLGTLLARARAAGDIRADTTAEDLRRYLVALEVAVRLTDTGHGPDAARAARDLDVLLTGLRAAG